jgi:DNA helicase-2/ATP-dependent DNA helicase PcrA
VLHAVADEREEAETVAAEIERLLGGASFHALDSFAVDGRERPRDQLSFADFAVLYRTSAQAGAVGEALARRGFPFQRRSHSRLAEMPGVDRVLAALRPSLPGSASPAVAELLPAAVESALSAPALSLDPEAIIAVRTAAEVLTPLAARCGTDLDRFVEEIAVGAEVDTWDPRADRITLLTLHAAKGLEFPVVFITGCDDGLLPLRAWRGAEVDYAEERRLLFVGMTRATTRLTLLTAAKRTLRGEVTRCAPSPFLSSVDPALFDRRGGETARSRRRATARQATLF